MGRPHALPALRTFAASAKQCGQPGKLSTYNSANNVVLIADLIQDMYVRELRAYKPPQVKASDAEGHVQKFSAPKPPKSPEEADMASDLQSYENQQVEVEGQAPAGESAAVEEDWFEEEEEAAPTGH